MKRLVPEIFINYNIYLETKFNTINAVIKLARLPGEKVPDISVRRE